MSQATWTAVDRLIASTLDQPDEVLLAARAASSEAGLPEIAVSPAQGKLLHLLARSLGARSILEVGTLGGYSAIWLARALPEGGRMVSLELDPSHAEVARANLARAGLGDRVDVRVGPALEGLTALAAEAGPAFDLAFIDADRPHGPAYFERAVGLTRRGGLVVVDNVVRGGLVADDTGDDPGARDSRRLWEAAGADPRVSATVVQTVGMKGYDGFLLALVLGSAS